jgi:hypothetical protein
MTFGQLGDGGINDNFQPFWRNSGEARRTDDLPATEDEVFCLGRLLLGAGPACVVR